jgi:CRISPR-associated protein Csx3
MAAQCKPQKQEEKMAELTYVVKLEKSEKDNHVLRIKFGTESHNGPKVRDAKAQLDALLNAGAFDTVSEVFVNGPASLPVAMTIAHSVSHVVEVVACYDPKVNHYVVSVAHGGKYTAGDVIEADQV